MTQDETHILSRLRDAIADRPYAGPVAEADIAGAEAVLGVRFPRSYRIFLKHFGAVWLPHGYEVAGLGPGRGTDPEPPLWSHVVDGTARVRRASRGQLPQEYVRVSDDGADCAFYLDTRREDAQGECPVVVLGPGRDGGMLAPSFVEFVERAVTGTLAY
jgi:hypothetical protein